MPLKARQRSRLAVLAVLALVGSLLAVSAVPVAAEDGKVDAKAMYSACVGPAAEDAGFTDTGGNTHEAAINCLAHYGITMGTSEGVYSPSAAVTRAQMALFLHRAAAPAGIDLPAASDQGFTDIGNWSDDAQSAINLMAELGIMAGRSSTEFIPTDLVTRADMAVHIAEFLDNSILGPGGTDIDDVDADDMVFTDINNATKSAYDAIRKLYELGVTSGTTDTTYSPEGLITRAQMAAFITRAMAHTNARPAGLTVQTESTDAFVNSSVEFVASLRDANHLPIADGFVDHFYFVEDDEDDEPFDDDGVCIDDEVSGGCDITSDPTTDVDGNVEDLSVDVDTNHDIRVWFWTGDLGDEFDEDDDEAITFTINTSPAAHNTQLTFSHNNSTNKAKFGETVTLTIQLVDSDNKPVMKKDVAVTVAISETHPDDSTTSSAKEHKTDASGQIVLSWTQEDTDSTKVNQAIDVDDPDTAEVTEEDEGQDGTVTVTVSDLEFTAIVGSASDATAVNADGDAIADGDQDTAGYQAVFVAMWDDDPSVPTNLTLSAARGWAKVSNKGRGASNSVRATLTDQYGDGINKAKISFVSVDAGPSLTAGSDYSGATNLFKTTNRNGVATLSYQRDSLLATTENFSAAYHRVVNGTMDEVCGTANSGETPADTEDVCLNAADENTDGTNGQFSFHWASSGDPGAAEATRTGSGSVTLVDKDANTAVVGTGSTVRYVEWDSDDAFTVGTGVLLAKFEEELDVGDTLTWDYAGEDEDGDGVATFAITV